MTADQLISFLAWCTLINFIWLMVATIFLYSGREWIMDMHSRMMGVAREEMPGIYMRYLANFKIAWIVFNLTPYLALRIAV